jgi:hypothetical protein
MSPEVSAAVVGAITGAFAGGLISLWVSRFQDRLKIRSITSQLRLVMEPKVGTRVTARVINGSVYPIRGAVAYITIDHRTEDVMIPPLHFEAFSSKGHPKQVVEDRLCWSANSLVPKPMSIDIFSGEHQSLDVADLGDWKSEWIEFPSEMGYASSQPMPGPVKSRVFLGRSRKYDATIKIVSADTREKIFTIRVDTSDLHRPIEVVGG